MNRNKEHKEMYSRSLEHQQDHQSNWTGRLFVDRKPLKSDAQWYGAAPRPIDPEKRNWRPKDIVF